jgi:predicted metal-dependent phosphoesterase TrpH
MAKRKGLSAVAVTDHDTFQGAREAVSAGERYGIRVIPGAEFSCTDSTTGRKAHVLCYRCAAPDGLADLCRSTCEARRRAGEAMLEKVAALYPISREMVLRRVGPSASLYKQHIMHALIDAGYTSELFGDVFQRLFSAHGGKAYVKIEYPDVHDVIDQIHRAGGLAVLAHPGEYDSYDLLNRLAASHEIDGVEVWHSRSSEADVHLFAEIARNYGLLMTGGTDFHGMYTKVPRPIGTCAAPNEEVERLLQWKQNR